MGSPDWFARGLPARSHRPSPHGVPLELLFARLFGDGEAVFWLDRTAEAGVSVLGRGARRTVAAIDEFDGPGPAPDLTAKGSPCRPGERDLVGWIGYDDRYASEAPAHPSPAAEFVAVDRALIVSTDGRLELAAPDAVTLRAWELEVAEALLAPAPPAPPLAPKPGPGDDPAPAEDRPQWATARAEHLRRVRRCQHAIAEGDAYVINLSTEVHVPGVFDPVALFARLRAESPARKAALIRIGGTTLISTSPEEFLRVGADGHVSTSPVKGTRRRRLDDPEHDRAEAALLRADPKERAENVMIVDLMRNDLARVCEPSTVTVTRLLEVETLPWVHQLVSTVEGDLRRRLTAADAVAACFPAGSMTGAPKQSAMRLIAGIEARRRGLYAGAFGYLGADGEADLAMTIRSVVLGSDGARVAVGGGITAGSVPEREADEVELKAEPLLRALGVTGDDLRMPTV
ncbi:MAG: anthranilate synthase component I family protein [Herbiconiux sp.]|nr:anthranilate synthase component I family protein [Herbiconiux sp.]